MVFQKTLMEKDVYLCYFYSQKYAHLGNEQSCNLSRTRWPLPTEARIRCVSDEVSDSLFGISPVNHQVSCYQLGDLGKYNMG